MASIRFTVTYLDDKKLDVRVSPKAQVLFERKYNTGMAEMSSNPKAEHLYYLAWSALHCAGMEGRDFEEFLGLIAEVERSDPGEDEDPTRSAPGQEPLSS